MDKLFSMSSLKWLVAIGILLAGLAYWVNWSFDMTTKVANQETTIGDRNKTIEDLRSEVKTYTSDKKENRTWFDALEDAQIDLLCAARTGTPIPTPSTPSPQIVEVVKYRDRVSQCPTSDATKAETFDPKVSELRPINEEVALQALNNSWKAFCNATKNKDETCEPFR
ncbi:hypothetical protein D3C87_965540 [compost metagenome]